MIASEVIAYLRESDEEAARREAVAALADLAERYAPDHQWFVDTVNQLFEAAGEAGCWAGAALGGGVGLASRGPYQGGQLLQAAGWWGMGCW